MEHKAQLENVKYRNWVRAGLGIKYVKEGLEPFCDYLVNQQHIAILDKVKQKHSLSTVSCGLCDVRTLQPDHVQSKSRQCPLGQTNCNCLHPRGKTSCPSNVCGSIYDEIIKCHASTPPAPYWRNTDAHQWCTEPWAVAKCFLNAPGYEQKKSVVEFDCSGLLHLLINNIEFHQHIQCVISGNDVFSRVLRHRNAIFHSDNMELEDTDITAFLNDMIELLQDEKEIKEREESKGAVKKLLELMQEKFIITTTDETEIRIAMAAVAEKEKNLEHKIVDAKNEIGVATDESEQKVKKTGSMIKDELVQKGLEMKEDLTKTELDLKERLEQREKEIKEALRKKEVDFTEKIDQKKIEIKENLRMTEFDSKERLKQKETEIKENLRMTEVDSKQRLKQKETEIKENLRMTEVDSKERLKQKETEIKENLRMIEVEAKERLNQKRKETEEDLERKAKHILYQLDRKQSSQVQREPRRCDISKEAADDLMKVGFYEMKIPYDYERMSAEFQEKLVKRYEKYILKVSSVPLKPHRKQGNVCDVYVPPWMTVEESNRWEEDKISMHDIFRYKERHAKYIYVIGDAGTGKSMLSKMLVHFWCIAQHQEIGLDKSDILLVKEMQNFKYLFHVSLRHFSDCDSIEKMLKKSYLDPALGNILKNESGKCLIVLDGLDEWKPVSKHVSQFLTPGLPGRELDADYTIITTSRQWKFDVLQINDSEVDKKIKLIGIDENEIKHFTEKTVKMLNDNLKQNKNAEDCITDLQNKRVSDIRHIPLILQQLICLWYDNKLQVNSKCAIYSNTLALFFEWNTLKNQECEIDTQERMKDSPLPDYLLDFKAPREDLHVIQYLSQLAYERLFEINKEETLTFSDSVFQRLNIPNGVVKYCLNIGILTEEQNVSLPASTSQQSLFSFFHKSMQEYLAAVYVASEVKEMINTRKLFQKDNHNLADICKTCVGKYFGSCKTVVDILDQSNMLSMLCGLEPRLLTNISEYIYDVTLVDKMVVEERNTLPEDVLSLNHHQLIEDIQACIFMCIEEVMSSAKNVHPPVFIADLSVSCLTDLQEYQNIIINKVKLVDVDELRFRNTGHDQEKIYLPVEHLTKCDQLKVIKSNSTDERINNNVYKMLDTNISSLETVSLVAINEKTMTRLVSLLPKMGQLTTVQIASHNIVNISNHVCLSLCTYLNQATSLQHIKLDIECEKHEEHVIDLSEHKHLQQVYFQASAFRMVSCNTDNLETCRFGIISGAMMNQVCSSLYSASKLKYLWLQHDVLRRPNKEYSRIVTENLIRLLPSLVNLSTLTLWFFRFTDSIIARPCEMKNLREITLLDVTMSMPTWCKFLDSLPKLPQVVKVTNIVVHSKDVMFGYSLCEEKQKIDTQRYVQHVREKTNLFRVTHDQIDNFEFTTKKV